MCLFMSRDSCFSQKNSRLCSAPFPTHTSLCQPGSMSPYVQVRRDNRGDYSNVFYDRTKGVELPIFTSCLSAVLLGSIRLTNALSVSVSRLRNLGFVFFPDKCRMNSKAGLTFKLIFLSLSSFCNSTATEQVDPKEPNQRESLLLKWHWYWLLYIMIGWEIRRILTVFLQRSPVHNTETLVCSRTSTDTYDSNESRSSAYPQYLGVG